MAIQPTDKRMIIELDPEVKESEGGIIYAQEAVRYPRSGIVIIAWDEAHDFLVGKRVHFRPGAFTQFDTIAGDDLTIVHFGDVMAIEEV